MSNDTNISDTPWLMLLKNSQTCHTQIYEGMHSETPMLKMQKFSAKKDDFKLQRVEDELFVIQNLLFYV